MPVITLTPKFMSTLQCEPGKSRTEWCDKNQPGLYCEARATSPGNGTFYLRYKDLRGTTRHLRLGTTATTSLAQARSLAKEKQAEVRLGADPSGDLRKQKEVITFAEFSISYLDYVRPRKKSYRDDEIRLGKILPVLGHYPLNKIDRLLLVQYHLSLAQSGLRPATTNHYIKLLRYALNLAVDWGLIKTNPASRIKLLPEDNRQNPSLSEEQMKKLLSVLRNDDHPVSHLALLLLSTGTRKSEAMKSVWSDFDLPNKLWYINRAYSKSGKTRAVPLSDTALAVLEKLKTPDGSGPLFTIKTVDKKWRKLKEEAGVGFLTLHSLRHLYATSLINTGSTLYIVQKILGHSSPIVTERYSHLTNKGLLDAARKTDAAFEPSTPKTSPPALKLIGSGS